MWFLTRLIVLKLHIPTKNNQCITSFENIGFALDCLVCGDSTSTPGVCQENENGTSITCPDSATGAAIQCAKSNCTKDGETMIIRACAYPLPELTKTEATPKLNECQDHVRLVN